MFIGGGGSIELIFVNNKKIIKEKYYNFGVVDITNKYKSLKEDIPSCTFEQVYNYIDNILDDIKEDADVLILAGGNHLYWYNNARYKLEKNTLYNNENQKYMITIENSDNPIWFDYARAMKVITNLISHRIKAKYIIPTKINMEDGIKIN